MKSRWEDGGDDTVFCKYIRPITLGRIDSSFLSFSEDSSSLQINLFGCYMSVGCKF